MSFSGLCSLGRLVVSPIKLEDLHSVFLAKRRISDASWRLYVSGDPRFHSIEKHVLQGPLQPGQTGRVFFKMEIDGEIVGLSNHSYIISDFENYVCDGGLVVLDEYHRKGIATAYSLISVNIAKSMGVSGFVGVTRANSPMHKLRARQGWECRPFTIDGMDWVRVVKKFGE